jgi:hypothetical protein
MCISLLRPRNSAQEWIRHHAWLGLRSGADQCVCVGSGTKQSIVKTAAVELRAGALLLITRGDKHDIRKTGSLALWTLNVYVPPPIRLPSSRRLGRHAIRRFRPRGHYSGRDSDHAFDLCRRHNTRVTARPGPFTSGLSPPSSAPSLPFSPPRFLQPLRVTTSPSTRPWQPSALPPHACHWS